jgi:DNA-binding XRE family transcriptional regulator
MREDLLMDPGNSLRRVREARMLSKAELARRAGISPLTIDRIEKGMPCRIATRRKILLALGLKLSQWRRVFKEN